ncbi:MAG: metal ABC transporter substrate-binding protein [Phycisphaerales bacterium JB041]
MWIGSRGWGVRVGWLWAAAALVLAAGCGPREDSPREERPRESGAVRVVVSVPPLASLVRSMLPADAEVRVLVPPGGSPHGFAPSPSDIAAVARADLVVLVGMGIESGLPASLHQGSRAIWMAEAVGVQAAADHGHSHDDHGHAHGHGDEHAAHGGADPHLWLDPSLVEAFLPELAERVVGALERAGASDAETGAVGARLAALLTEVRAVDGAYRERLAAHRGAVITTQHAAWSRLTDRYGLVVASEIQVAEQAEPSAGRMAEIVRTAEERGVRAVLTEPQMNRAVAGRLAEQLGVPLGMLDPLGTGDWTAMMRANLDALVAVLGGDADGGG